MSQMTTMVDSHQIDKDLSPLYYNLNSDVAYASSKQLYDKVKPKYTKKQVDEWLLRQLSHTLHRSRRRKYVRRQMYAIKPNHQIQADLADMTYMSKANSDYKYFLLVIDVFSRKIYTRLLKTKNGSEVSARMEEILKSMAAIPRLLCTDRGGEFLSRAFKRLLEKYDIRLFHTQNYDVKAAMAERAIRTIKSKLYKYITANHTEKWMDALSKITDNYNNTYHSIIKEKPNNVTLADVERIFHNSWKPRSGLGKVLKVGDYVRLANVENIFSRGFLPLWTDQIYIIQDVLSTQPVTYRVKEINGDELIGTFYKEELQRVGVPDEQTEYRVERVIMRRGKKLYVKWLGYPESENSWINQDDWVVKNKYSNLP